MDIFYSFISKTDTIKMNNEIYESVTKAFIDSNYIKSDIIPKLFEKIQKGLNDGFGLSNVFDYKDCLTLDEKKKLGYPTRKKISREMIDSLSSDGQKLDDPKGAIEGLYYKQYNQLYKKYKLASMKNMLLNDSNILGFKIIAALDFNTCIICGAYDGTIIKTVAELDNFENRKCGGNCCGCEYVPVQKGMGDIMSSGMTYAGWFRKLSVEDKKDILGEYYSRYKNGESIKDIALLFTAEIALKHFQDRETRERLREQEEAKKPKEKQDKLPKLTEEQLQEYRDLMIKHLSSEWCNLHLDKEIEIMRKRTAKEQHIRLEHYRKKN